MILLPILIVAGLLGVEKFLDDKEDRVTPEERERLKKEYRNSIVVRKKDIYND